MGNGVGMEVGSGDVVRFNILERIGRLSHNDKSGWSKEVNIVAWNDYPPKVDIREWDPNHERMSRGVTLHELEAVKLANMLLKKFPPEEYANNKYQNKGARNRSGNGRVNGRSQGNGNGNFQSYGSGGQRYGNSSGHNAGYYRDDMNSGHYTDGQRGNHNIGEADGNNYRRNDDEGRSMDPQRESAYSNNEEAEIQEFGLMGDGEQRYQECGDAGELYEDYIPGLDAAMPDGDEEPESTGAGEDDYATPSGDFQGEGSDEAGSEEVEPF